ncbi:hypothetical protein SDC9_126534 [bioreactor metagenome]|uniref:Uncharacterized protein n=1 Tax=bioreactor metagenome TaxID=1076179 RepID=A0A645CRF7_9ZZZZ
MIDTKAMLLIRHDAPKVIEPNIFGEKGMRTRDKERAAVCNFPQYFVALRLFHAAFEQHDRIAKDFTKIEIVLLRQYLSRRQQHALLAVRGCNTEGKHGNRRLARTDIALQQPVHRHRLLHIALNFGDHAALRLRKLEFQLLFEFSKNAAGVKCKPVLAQPFRLLEFYDDKV